MALLQPKVPFWVFPCFCWNPYFYSVSSLGRTTKKWHFPKTDSCNENAHLFFTFRTQIVFAYFSKKWQCYKKNIFLHNHPKTLFFWFFFLKFSFPLFSCFLFFFFQHKIDKNKKCTCFFENPFLTPSQTAKKIFSHPYTLFAFFKIPQNTIKLGKTSKKKSWTRFWRNLGPGFDSKNPKSWTRFWLYSIYIYIFVCMYICVYIYIRMYACMLESYFLYPQKAG